MAAKLRGAFRILCRVVLGLVAALFLLRMLVFSYLAGGHGFETPKERKLLPPEPITAAMEREGQIYVLYGGTAVVDVYDSGGGFLWAVSVPYHDHNEDAMMKLEEGSLFLYQARHTVYEYRCSDGRYLGSFPQDQAQERFPGGGYQSHSVRDGEAAPGGIYFNDLDVFRGDETGALVPVIVRSPLWRLLYFPVVWALAFSFSLAGFFSQQLFRPRRMLRERHPGARPQPQDPLTRQFLRFARGTVALDLAYAAAMLTAGLVFHWPNLSIGIMPLAVWFILGNVVMENRVRRVAVAWTTDALLIETWKGYLWASFLAAFASVPIGSLAG